MAFGRGFDSPRLHSPSTEKREDTLCVLAPIWFLLPETINVHRRYLSNRCN